MTETQQYASESQRFYLPDGTPMGLVPNKSKPGEFRKPTLADARKVNAVPSVTTILGVLSKPGLDIWKQDQYLNQAYGMPPIDGEDKEGWISAVKSRANVFMDYCRDLGTEVHGAINRHFQGQDSEERFDPYLEAAVKALTELGLMHKDVDVERSFVCPQWGYGGCVDYGLTYEPVIVDFKCIDRLDKPWTHKERLAQISAYMMGKYDHIEGKGYNIAICTNEPGTYAIREWSQEELSKGWEIFRSANSLWRAINDYQP